MKHKYTLLNLALLLTLFSFLLTPCSVFAKDNIKYESLTLDNGLEVVVLPNSRAPVVYHSIWYKVGSADSPQDKTGLAHFLEHLMFQGSKHFPKDTFKKKVNELGGDQNANTTWDRTAFFVTIAKEYLPLVMEMEADRMQNLNFTEEGVKKEIEVVLQERRSNSDPFNRLGEAANAAFFWQHPYGKPVIGFEEHIRQYTLADAEQFYKSWYAPNNAILVIAGDVTLEKIKPLIQKYYGSIPKRTLQNRTRLEEPTHRDVTAKVEIRDPQMGGAAFEKIYAAPNHRTSSTHQEAVLTLLQDILGDESFGRLSQNLVEKQKIAQNVGCHYTGYYRDPYSFTIMASPINLTDVTLLEASIESEIRRLISEGVTDDELKRAKEQWQFNNLYQRDSLDGLANVIGENFSLGYSLSEINQWLNEIQSVTKEEIKQAAKEVLGKAPIVTAYAYPAAQKQDN